VARERTRRLLRRGSVPLVVHGLLEYGIGVLLIAAPSLFSFDSDGGQVASVLFGAGVLVITGVTDMPTALLRRLPLDSHIVLDYVIGVLLIASPFVLGFSDDGTAVASFIIIGLAYLFLTAVTRFHPRHERD
jgi:VIT1/CCC1 family predicted Fe2+/Mn2+ transporter